MSARRIYWTPFGPLSAKYASGSDERQKDATSCVAAEEIAGACVALKLMVRGLLNNEDGSNEIEDQAVLDAAESLETAACGIADAARERYDAEQARERAGAKPVPITSACRRRKAGRS